MRRTLDTPAEFAKADFDFHLTPVNESGNGPLRSILMALSDVFEKYI